MPISGDWEQDKNSRCFGLPSDTYCVGGGGPSPEEARLISKPAAKLPKPPGELRIQGGRTEGWGGPSGKSPAQSSDARGSVPTGYDGP